MRSCDQEGSKKNEDIAFFSIGGVIGTGPGARHGAPRRRSSGGDLHLRSHPCIAAPDSAVHPVERGTVSALFLLVSLAIHVVLPTFY